MPPSSYPPPTSFTPGATPPGAPLGATSHPHHAQQHVQAGLAPCAPPAQGPFHGPLGQQGPSQHPMANQQHGQQQQASVGAYDPRSAHQQPLASTNPAAQFPPYSQQGSPYTRPPGPTAGPRPQPAAGGYPQQAHGFGQQALPYSMPAAQMHMQSDYGHPRQPGMERGVQAMGAPGQHGGVQPQQGMSQQEMAQQAEKKRRFTEQKREDQLHQVSEAGSLTGSELADCTLCSAQRHHGISHFPIWTPRSHAAVF